MGDEDCLFKDAFPRDLFGQPITPSVRVEVDERTDFLKPTDSRGQLHLSFREPERDVYGNGMLFAGRTLVGDEDGQCYGV